MHTRSGMLLGNAITGMSVGLTTVLDELTAGRERVEALLALGASRAEAAAAPARRALSTALAPMLNSMSVVGLVSIPGARSCARGLCSVFFCLAFCGLFFLSRALKRRRATNTSVCSPAPMRART